MNKIITTSVAVFFSIFQLISVYAADAPQKFDNDPAAINPDPNYTPGTFPLADRHDARTFYFMKRQELFPESVLTNPNIKITNEWGEISFACIKNETAKVLGYFRHYTGALALKGMNIQSLTLLVDINSLDTAVAGRDNRILDILFQSMKPELGVALITLNDMQTRKLSKQGNTTQYSVVAKGTISLNNITYPLQTKLNISQQDQTWTVELAEPISLLLSDFGLSQHVYDLMKACNHKSIGNGVEIKAKIYLK